MPAYFSMVIQRSSNKTSHDYVEQIYSKIVESGYPFKSGFWFHSDATYDEIVKWNQNKLEQGFKLGFTEHGSNDYMQIIFEAPEFSQMRGFWMYNKTDVTFNLLIPEYDILNYEGGNKVLENKIAPIRAIGIQMWEEGLADAIQTNIEFDCGYYSLNEILCGKNLMVHPFAIIHRNVVPKFNSSYFIGKKLESIGNGGVLINSNNNLLD